LSLTIHQIELNDQNLFFEYAWNNLLHTLVFAIFKKIFESEVNEQLKNIIVKVGLMLE